MPDETRGESRAVAHRRMFTVESLTGAFRAAGLHGGETILLHSSLQALGGWVCGGPVAVVEALLHVLGPTGTLMVPTHTSDNSDPCHWRNPPVPESWWDEIRAQMSPYRPEVTPTRGIGKVAEVVRQWPGARRSNHPMFSFAAVGVQTETLCGGETALGDGLGESSPLGRLYDLDGAVMLLGVGHESNTSLHLAEARADYGQGTEQQGSAILDENGQRRWATYEQLAWDSGDFAALGAAFETAHPQAVVVSQVGAAAVRLLRQRPLVDFGVTWLEAHRTASR